MKNNTIAIIRAARALSIPLIDRSIWSDLAARYELPAMTPEVMAWIARHPEAGSAAPDGRIGRLRISRQHATIASVLAAPAKHRAAEKRAYRNRLGLARFA